MRRLSASSLFPAKTHGGAIPMFSKERRGAQTWTEKDLAKALKISLAEAKQAVLVLQLQRYIEPAGETGKWRISEAGDVVSGAKPPRFTRASVEKALNKVRERLQVVNADTNSEYKITSAVAFGDFLADAARVQAAEVGIQLTTRNSKESPASAKVYKTELAFLKQLRGKSTFLHIVPFEGWMRSRSSVALR